MIPPRKCCACLGLVALLLLVGCEADGSVSTAKQDVALAENKSVPSPATVVSDRPTRNVTVGSMGGSIRLTETIGAIYSIALRDGGAWLEGVALLRGNNSGWYNRGADTVPLAPSHMGVGGSLGKHLIIVTENGNALWADDQLNVPFRGDNVALFEGAGESLTLVGTVFVEAYLGPASLEVERDKVGQRAAAPLLPSKALVQDRLRVLLNNSAAIKAAWPTR